MSTMQTISELKGTAAEGAVNYKNGVGGESFGILERTTGHNIAPSFKADYAHHSQHCTGNQMIHRSSKATASWTDSLYTVACQTYFCTFQHRNPCIRSPMLPAPRGRRFITYPQVNKGCLNLNIVQFMSCKEVSSVKDGRSREYLSWMS